MKKFYTLTALLMCFMFAASIQLNAQQAEMFQTYIIYDLLDGGGNQYYAGGINADGAAQYNGTAFGTPSSLILNGGEIKTYKNNGGDVTGAIIHYNVHLASDPPGAFTAVNLPWNADLGNGDQKWTSYAEGIDVLAGLAPGDYELEVYWQITTNLGDRFDSNFGNNFSGTFTVPAPPPSAAVPTLGQWGLILFGLLLLCSGAIVVWNRQYRLKEVEA